MPSSPCRFETLASSGRNCPLDTISEKLAKKCFESPKYVVFSAATAGARSTGGDKPRRGK